MVLHTELKKLGLKDKESAVYLACLELGPAPVQQIARKAKVVRATTYVVLESLAKQGLVTQFKEGKKTLFAAEPPRQLLRLLEKQEEQIEERKHELEHVLPELQALVKSTGDRATVRYFDGVEGLRAIRREMAMYSRSGDEWLNFTPTDHLAAVFGRSDIMYTEQRVAKGISSKTLFTTKSPKLKEQILQDQKPHRTERRFVPPQDFPVASGMTIYRDRIAIGNFTGHIGGIIIESEAMANMLRAIFMLAWETAEGLD